jgi:rubrerythrin
VTDLEIELLKVAKMAEQVCLMELGRIGAVEFSPRDLLEAAQAAIEKAKMWACAQCGEPREWFVGHICEDCWTKPWECR